MDLELFYNTCFTNHTKKDLLWRLSQATNIEIENLDLSLGLNDYEIDFDFRNTLVSKELFDEQGKLISSANIDFEEFTNQLINRPIAYNQIRPEFFSWKEFWIEFDKNKLLENLNSNKGRFEFENDRFMISVDCSRDLIILKDIVFDNNEPVTMGLTYFINEMNQKAIL